MYLKKLELIGFKSFANKTVLEFGPGLSGIVGPNGCGKSNVSDAIRWVLGEQSAKALRGKKMEDIIFNGTDDHKPLGMAEVSVTFTEVEDRLDTDFHEVTITRRVFRSGEGQYFINKKPCRLKDIHRLFMDSGVGKGSYSILEQGKIDQILSSRPEDRRAVFEEASGITKYKADKREAERKLKQTEDNLTRVEDIIREVKRRIISLQRQAGKARRYQSLKDELRGIDLYLSRRHLTQLDTEQQTAAQRVATFTHDLDALRTDIESMEMATAADREKLAGIETGINAAMEAAMQAKTALDTTLRTIATNQERITELKDIANRDTADAAEAESRLGEHRNALTVLEKTIADTTARRDAALTDSDTARTKVEEIEDTLNKSRKTIRERRDQLERAENQINAHQTELADLSERDRATIIRRERLLAESQEVAENVERLGHSTKNLDTHNATLLSAVDEKRDLLQGLLSSREEKAERVRAAQQQSGHLNREIAASQAALKLLAQQEAQQEQFPGGARLLLNPETAASTPGVNPAQIHGALADLIKAKPGYESALESALRSVLDAVVVANGTALRETLRALKHTDPGSARLLNAAPADIPAPAPNSLLQFVEADPTVRDLAAALLGPIQVADVLDQVPADAPLAVTKAGILLQGGLAAEYFSHSDQASNPLHIQHLKAHHTEALEKNQDELTAIQATLKTLSDEDSAAAHSINLARVAAEEARRVQAQHEGELQSLRRQHEQMLKRQKAVEQELIDIEAAPAPGEARRRELVELLETERTNQASLRQELNEQEELLQKIEITRGHLAAESAEKRVAHAEINQQVHALEQQKGPAAQRIREVENLIANRTQGIEACQTRVTRLTDEITRANAALEPARKHVETQNQELETARAQRQSQADQLQITEKNLREKRGKLEGLSDAKNKTDIALAEAKVRRTALLQRIEADYDLTHEELLREPEPEWPEEGVPPDAEIEKQVNGLRKKLDSMGPVNLVAIEEHAELEERYTFLLQEQQDIVQSKDDLVNQIKGIETKTFDLFMTTFRRINENFQDMFTRLFGGGTARLELINEEEALDSGIDIIARPPGKKPQTISLLSGGERTMTAVALLFSLYQVKPSPFCFLDELDAALDDANIGRFVDTLKMFLEKSQFIVITHNRLTIGAADVLYGVTMQEKGVSRIVSVNLNEAQKAAS